MSLEAQDLLVTLLGFLDGRTGWTLCWRRSRDGSAGSAFHNGCDSKGATVTIVKYSSYIFGGYSVVDWNGTSGMEQRDLLRTCFKCCNYQSIHHLISQSINQSINQSITAA